MRNKSNIFWFLIIFSLNNFLSAMENSSVEQNAGCKEQISDISSDKAVIIVNNPQFAFEEQIEAEYAEEDVRYPDEADIPKETLLLWRKQEERVCKFALVLAAKRNESHSVDLMRN